MISVVLMAGYNNKRAVKKYSKIVAEHYGEKFIESGYKPLREFKAVMDGKAVSKPLIQFTLEKLTRIESIGEVVIVGHQMLLEQRLGNYLQEYPIPCKVINQNARIPQTVQKTFNIVPRKVKFNSVSGNMIKGYSETNAFREKRHALFMASDSPLTTVEFIKRFHQAAAQCEGAHSIILPAVLIEEGRDRLGRTPLRLINDSEYQISDRTDDFGRQGFRLSSLLYANPYDFDVNTANTAYNLRKCLSPHVQIKLFRITRNLGYKNVYSKHFFQKDLSVKEVENITSAFFNGRLKLIPMRGEEASYDYDGTDDEYRGISEMLGSKEQTQDNQGHGMRDVISN